MTITFTKIVLLCLLGHYFADFTLQGCLAQMKQKQWWIDTINKYNSEHVSNPIDLDLYKNDWRTSLFAHGLYWSLITFLPIILFTNTNDFFLIFIVFFNAIVHTVIDNMKANLHMMTLKQDQAWHFIQISLTLFATYTFYIQKI